MVSAVLVIVQRDHVRAALMRERRRLVDQQASISGSVVHLGFTSGAFGAGAINSSIRTRRSHRMQYGYNVSASGRRESSASARVVTTDRHKRCATRPSLTSAYETPRSAINGASDPRRIGNVSRGAAGFLPP